MVQLNNAAAGNETSPQSAESGGSRGLIGALADGELDAAQAQRAIDALLADPELQAEWRRIHWVGDCLRSDETGAQVASEGFMERLSTRLAAEPTILAPTARRTDSWRRLGLPGLSIAAAVAMVSWVGWTNRPLAPGLAQGGSPATAMASTAPLSAPVSAPAGPAVPLAAAAPAAPSRPVDPAELREYLAAHEQFSSPQLKGMGSFHTAAWSTSQSDNAKP
jgi:negative regulator of sigma E activity